MAKVKVLVEVTIETDDYSEAEVGAALSPQVFAVDVVEELVADTLRGEDLEFEVYSPDRG